MPDITKEFKCGDSVFLLVNSTPVQAKVTAVNTFDRLGADNQVTNTKEYVCDKYNGVIDVNNLFKTMDELIADLKSQLEVPAPNKNKSEVK